ncbi:OmpA/MotB family protein [Novipirellula artificiosorum]|uniref:Motility protein B n=1 Tax=Novipirellula artificiosorum TaxID=2528016 RepID=A0A5C6D747_9BACT|nr:flagellar motor protein MotB [Novipirellula artificiosorum]TWU31537.1 Motility protein B [Novipirellula artificiosorum]
MDEEPEEMGIPEWVVTFGDMMSLLLTFFIMLVSLSEIKDEEKYQALVDSMKRSFGYARTIDALTPGDSRPRTQAFSVLSTTGRAKKKDTAKGGVPDKAPSGEDPLVRIVRPGQMTAVGSVVLFELGSDQLSAENREALKIVAAQLRGKPQKIEVRGHTSAEFAARTAGTDESIQLGFRRAIAVREVLVNTEALEPSRFRLSSAGESEPMHRAGGSVAIARNPRVEVFLLDETVEDLHGTAEERKAQTIDTSDLTAETE